MKILSKSRSYFKDNRYDLMLKELITTKDSLSLQHGMGLMRVCELQALAKVCDKIIATGYISIGCGDCWDIFSLQHNTKFMPKCLGFDINLGNVNKFPDDRVELYKTNIFDSNGKFTKSVLNVIETFCNSLPEPGNILFYTDNGYKLKELENLLPFMKYGDVIGTHDWGNGNTTRANTNTEVHEDKCGFILYAGLTHFTFIEPWLVENNCIQKFWQK